MLTSFRNPEFTRWIATLAAVLMIGAGKTLHILQEGGSCCKNHDQNDSDRHVEQNPCPFGCPHDSAQVKSEQEDSDSPHHDSDSCRLCLLLAEPASTPLIFGLIEVTDGLRLEVGIQSDSPALGVRASIECRGPPTVA